MKRFGKALWLASVLGIAPAARAEDTVEGTRGPEQIEDVAHQADIQLHPGWAKLVVRRTVHNRGPRTDQAVFSLETPPGAVAVRLRSQGLRAGQPVWFEGELLDRGLAERRYRELTGIGHAIPMDPALLYWVGLSRLGLQVFPVPSRESKTVEYTLLAPVTYREGRYRLELTPMMSPRLTASGVVQGEPGDTLFVGNRKAVQGTKVSLGEPGEVSFERGRAPRLDGALGVVPVSPRRALWSYRVEAAPRLSTVPAQAAVVVLLDQSRSLDESMIEDERTVTRAYLSHFPRARVGIVPFDRVARPLSDTLTSTQEALQRLSQLPLATRNGSHLDLALARAAAMLVQTPPSVERRVLVLSDTLTREALTEERLRRAFASASALAHVAVIGRGDSCTLERNDDHQWAGPVRATRGLVWSASAQGCADEDEAGHDGITASRIFEEMARPVRLHRLRLLVNGLDLRELDESDLPDNLHEGEGIRDLRLLQGTPNRVVVDGELWNAPVRLALIPSAGEGRIAAALAFGNPLVHDLSEQEQRTLAFHGRAVSPVTSYLAIEPGVRPSTEGLKEGEAIGTIGHGSGSGYGHAYSGTGSGGDPLEWLASRLREAWKRCKGTSHVSVELETTFDEVVDVLQGTAQERKDDARVSCLTDAAWDLELPPLFRREHARFAITL